MLILRMIIWQSENSPARRASTGARSDSKSPTAPHAPIWHASRHPYWPSEQAVNLLTVDREVGRAKRQAGHDLGQINRAT